MDFKLTSILRNIDPQFALPIAQTLLEQGFRSIEVSLSQPERGMECLLRLRDAFPADQLELGAGTVTRTQEIDALSEMGIAFFFTPGFDRELVAYGMTRPIAVIPGVFSPGEVGQAAAMGLQLLKLFPADALPMHYLKSLHGPFPHLRFLAVGGVTPENLGQYRSAGFAGAALGSGLVRQNATLADLADIADTAARCVAAVEG